VPLVFGHGFGCDQTMWDRLASDFQRDHCVVTFDYVGAGTSDRSAYDSARYATLHGYADDVVDLLDELQLPPVVFIGHSASGMIGMLASQRRPERFRALVCIGASPRYLNDAGYVGGFDRPDIDGLLSAMESNFHAWAQTMAPVVMGNPDRPDLAAELEASFTRSESRVALDFARAIFLSDYRAELGRTTLPTLIMQSSADPMVPDEVADYLHRSIPNSTLVKLGASGHYPHVSGTDETSRVISSFLQTVA
jgi:sigma-B regulation protein RsbQ